MEIANNVMAGIDMDMAKHGGIKSLGGAKITVIFKDHQGNPQLGADLAKKLIEEEKYDEALAKLDSLQPEGGSSTELIALKDVVTEKLINRERNNAAKLFLMARSETNPAKKEELLGSSLNILKNLLDKYPNTTLRKKINENMATIRDEMSRLKNKPGSGEE